MMATMILTDDSHDDTNIDANQMNDKASPYKLRVRFKQPENELVAAFLVGSNSSSRLKYICRMSLQNTHIIIRLFVSKSEFFPNGSR